ncbi:MAG: Leucineresponsive regulatory protein [Pseudomonadota bacterium]
MTELDRIDRKILDILQRQGRISMTELGEQIGLSTSPCAERVKRMERQGVITGYHARIDPKALEKPLLVFVEITLTTKSGEVFDKVRNQIANMPEVMECHLVSGSFDYLVKARRFAQQHLESDTSAITVAQLCGDGRSEGLKLYHRLSRR